jgi:pyruvate dehydrogenase E2 component (dihydrolipoamide acetyltransferase)
MLKEVKLPALGENVESADVLSVLVSPGDTIAPEQSLLEVETDKATVEVPAPFGGVVKEVRVKAGEQVTVGQTILTLEVDGECAEAGRGELRGAGDSGDGGEARDRELVRGQTETRAAAPARSSPRAVTGAGPDRGGRGADEEGVDTFGRSGAAARHAPREREPAEEAWSPPAHGGDDVAEAAEAGDQGEHPPETQPAAAAPSVRRLARELGIDIGDVAGTGPGRHVSVEDVKRHARELIVRAGARRARPATPAAPLPDFAQWGAVEREAMSGVRRSIAVGMGRSWTIIPHVTQFDRADITDLEGWRKTLGERTGTKLTVTAVALKVAAAALRAFPKFNASIDAEREEIIYKKYVHVAVAVDTPAGLIAPVVRDADRKSLVAIARELAELSEKARRRKVSREELAGACFTVTNLGGLGTTYFSPIVNWPEVAVLGLGRASHTPVLVDGGFVPRLLLPLSVSYDHRLIDGADAARFLRWIAEALEQPLLLLLLDG